MNLLKEAFIEGYKQRAEGSDLIFDNASRMYAISLFDKYQAEQLTLTDVVDEFYCDIVVGEEGYRCKEQCQMCKDYIDKQQ